jgi:hypothetical protein
MSAATLHVRYEEWSGRLLVQWRASDSKLWHAILEDLKLSLPYHSQRSYRPTQRVWSVAGRCRGRLMQWADTWFEPQNQVWEGDDHDDDDPEEDDGWGSYKASATAPTPVTEALALLHLLPSAPEELVQAAHRIMAKRCHPDRGGSHEQAVAINRAMDLLRRSGRGGGP